MVEHKEEKKEELDVVALSMEQHEKEEQIAKKEKETVIDGFIFLLQIFIFIFYFSIAVIVYKMDVDRPYQATIISGFIILSVILQISSYVMKTLHRTVIWLNNSYMPMFYTGIIIHLLGTMYVVYLIAPIFQIILPTLVGKYILLTWVILSSSFVFLVPFLKKK